MVDGGGSRVAGAEWRFAQSEGTFINNARRCCVVSRRDAPKTYASCTSLGSVVLAKHVKDCLGKG